jgi:hypothetical protein
LKLDREVSIAVQDADTVIDAQVTKVYCEAAKADAFKPEGAPVVKVDLKKHDAISEDVKYYALPEERRQDANSQVLSIWEEVSSTPEKVLAKSPFLRGIQEKVELDQQVASSLMSTHGGLAHYTKNIFMGCVALVLIVAVLNFQLQSPIIVTSVPVCSEANLTRCHIAVYWARNTGVELNPEQYPGLNSHSSFSAFKRYFALQQYPQGCACNMRGAPRLQCYTELNPMNVLASRWTLCQKAMYWARSVEITHHPEWFPGLSTDSSYVDFQWYFAAQRFTQGCGLPCEDLMLEETTPSISNSITSLATRYALGLSIGVGALLVWILRVRNCCRRGLVDPSHYIMLE